MLIWQSHVNAHMKPAVDWAAEDREVAACIGLSWWGCWEVMGPVVKRPPQTGPKQPAGGIGEAPYCTDWPDSSDSSGEDRLSAGRWEEGYLSSQSGTPHPPYITLQNPSLSNFQSHSTSSLSLYLTVFLLLGFSAGSQAILKRYAFHVGPWTWTAARFSSTLLPWPAL